MAQCKSESVLGQMSLGFPLTDGAPRWVIYADFVVDDDVIYHLQEVANGIKGLGAVRTGRGPGKSFMVYMNTELSPEERRKLAELYLEIASRRLDSLYGHTAPLSVIHEISPRTSAMAVSGEPTTWGRHND